MPLIDFEDEFLRIRNFVTDMAAIPEVAEVWSIADDTEFFETLDKIETAGRTKDTALVDWLAGLTQFDDPGPMGRALTLSRAAIASLSLMPKEAFDVAIRLFNQLPSDATNSQKMGVCLIFKASGFPAAIPYLMQFMNNEGIVFKAELNGIISELSQI